MANESFTHRIGQNDKNSIYRKSKFDTSSSTQASFFDQLLQIGNDIGAARKTPELPPAVRSGTSSSPSESTKRDEDQEDDSNEAPTPICQSCSLAPTRPEVLDGAVDGVDPSTSDGIQKPTARDSKSKSNSSDQLSNASSAIGSNEAVASEQGEKAVYQVDAAIGSESESNQREALQSDQQAKALNDKTASSIQSNGLDIATTSQSTNKPNADPVESSQTDSSSEIASIEVSGLQAVQQPKAEPPVKKVTSKEAQKSDESLASNPLDRVENDRPALSRRAERLADRNRQGDNTDDNDSSVKDSTQDDRSIQPVDESQQVVAAKDNSLAVQASNSSPSIEASLGPASFSFNPTTSFVSSVSASPTINQSTLAVEGTRSSTATASGPAIAGRSEGGFNSSSVSLGSGNGNSGTPSSSSRAETVQGATGSSSISPFQETKLVQRVLRGLEQLGTGGGQVKLRLHPPELGTLQMTLRIEGGQMHAKMEVENSMAKDALLHNVQSLKDRLSEQGMKIESFEVQVSSDGAKHGSGNSSLNQRNGFGSDSRWNEANSRFAQRNENRLSSEPASTDQRAPQAWTRNHGSLDLTV
jgi:flagellar hook-length control protein FliK